MQHSSLFVMFIGERLSCQCRTRCHSRKSCPCKQAGHCCSQTCHPGHNCTNNALKSTSLPVDLASMHMQTASNTADQKKWKNCCGVSLTERHKKILSNGEWLDDAIIDATQFMLKQQCPQVGGLQSTVLSEKFAMEIERGDFVQLLNVNNNHWLTVSTIGCKPSVINVYDSLYACQLNWHAQKVIANLMKIPYHTIEVNHIDVQRQGNGSDCGVFALAFATALCFDQNPTCLRFDQMQMRHHLISCIDRGHMELFPKARGSRQSHKPSKMQLIQVYCICRSVDEGTMIQCTTCNEWYHTKCISVPRRYVTNKELDWNCQQCSGNY